MHLISFPRTELQTYNHKNLSSVFCVQKEKEMDWAWALPKILHGLLEPDENMGSW